MGKLAASMRSCARSRRGSRERRSRRIRGHPKVERLRSAANDVRVGHNQSFAGPDDSGARAVAARLDEDG